MFSFPLAKRPFFERISTTLFPSLKVGWMLHSKRFKLLKINLHQGIWFHGILKNFPYPIYNESGPIWIMIEWYPRSLHKRRLSSKACFCQVVRIRTIIVKEICNMVSMTIPKNSPPAWPHEEVPSILSAVKLKSGFI